MKKNQKIFAVFFGVLTSLVIAGCTSTQSVVREFDASGNLVRETTQKTSVVSELTKSTKDKTVIVWESGWAAYMSASAATTEDPTPTVKMFAGKTDKGMISALPDQQNWDGIASTINATKYDLTVSATGISSGK